LSPSHATSHPSPQSLNNLSVIYTSQGRAGEATALLQAATQACPSYAEAWNNLGVLQRDIGAVADAIASYERAASLAPEQPNAGAKLVLALPTPALAQPLHASSVNLFVT
jgi:Flp pilus assembly protein TadD